MNLEEIEELVFFNLSFNISVKDTLKLIDRLDLKEYFFNLGYL